MTDTSKDAVAFRVADLRKAAADNRANMGTMSDDPGFDAVLARWAENNDATADLIEALEAQRDAARSKALQEASNVAWDMKERAVADAIDALPR